MTMVSRIENVTQNFSQPNLQLKNSSNSLIERIGKKNILMVAAFFSLGCFIGFYYGFYVGLGTVVSLIAGCAIYKKHSSDKVEDSPAEPSSIAKKFKLEPRIIPEKKNLDISNYQIDYKSHYADKINRPAPPQDRPDITRDRVYQFLALEENRKYYPNKKTKRWFFSGDSRAITLRYIQTNDRNSAQRLPPMGWVYLKNIVGKFLERKQRIEAMNPGDHKHQEQREYDVMMSDFTGKFFQITQRCNVRMSTVFVDMFYQFVRCDKIYLESLTFPNLMKAALYQKRKASFDIACTRDYSTASVYELNKFRVAMSEECGLEKDMLANGVRPCYNRLPSFYEKERFRERFNNQYSPKTIVDYLYTHIKENTENGQKGTIAERNKKRMQDFNAGNSPRSKINFQAFYNWLKANYDIDANNSEMIIDDKETVSKEMITLFLLHEKIIRRKETSIGSFWNFFSSKI